MEDMARLALVEQNLRDVNNFGKVLHELLDLINYILENPHDYELRTIKSDILKKNLESEAFQDYLKYIGFQTVDNQMTYPKEQTLSKLRIAQAAIERKIGFCCGPLTRMKNSINSETKQIQAKKPKLVPENILNTSNQFLLKIQSLFNDVLKYEDEELQSYARDQIPIVTLQLMAIDRLREHQRKIKNGETTAHDMPFDIALLMELLGWFKYKFFKWVDQPECEKCGGPTKFQYSEFMTSLRPGEESCTVEVYSCTRCRALVNFPRYNNPRTLLKTRRGRCGEWANCFTLLCRAMGYDTRYVYDTTDHVWCEVFDYDTNTWLHVDPCEAKLNAPLIYSHGWGKKLAYVIAVSRDDMQDVTWRYTTQHKEVLKRRTLCSEESLISAMLELRSRRQRQVSEARRRYLQRRTVEELAQFLTERKPGDYESHGRISGSKEWRTERGEAGKAAAHEFTFSQSGDITIQYFPAADEYRISGPEPGVLGKWSSGAYSASNIFRKVETDWQQVYLAREESEEPGVISWRVSAASGRQFSSMDVRATFATFEGALVRWTVSFDDAMPQPTQIGETPVRFERRFKTAQISATLQGGSGDLSWQHAQLFRMPTTSTAAGLTILATLVDPQHTK